MGEPGCKVSITARPPAVTAQIAVDSCVTVDPVQGPSSAVILCNCLEPSWLGIE